jgi:hypothetical protein
VEPAPLTISRQLFAASSSYEALANNCASAAARTVSCPVPPAPFQLTHTHTTQHDARVLPAPAPPSPNTARVRHLAASLSRAFRGDAPPPGRAVPPCALALYPSPPAVSHPTELTELRSSSAPAVARRPMQAQTVTAIPIVQSATSTHNTPGGTSGTERDSVSVSVSRVAPSASRSNFGILAGGVDGSMDRGRSRPMVGVERASDEFTNLVHQACGLVPLRAATAGTFVERPKATATPRLPRRPVCSTVDPFVGDTSEVTTQTSRAPAAPFRLRHESIRHSFISLPPPTRQDPIGPTHIATHYGLGADASTPRRPPDIPITFIRAGHTECTALAGTPVGPPCGISAVVSVPYSEPGLEDVNLG